MSCFFPCFRNKEEEEDVGKEQLLVAQPPALLGSSSPQATPAAFPNKECSPTTPPPEVTPPSPVAPSNKTTVSKGGTEESGNSNAKTFTFRELASATKNFRQEYLIDEGGFGKAFKGTLPNEKVVTIKRLDRTGARDSKDFSVEVLVLTLLHHPNLLNLIGYCADGEQRLLVYEYMPMGCLRDHLFDLTDDKEPLNWLTRMKIASGVAQGLEYLHEKANPPIIYRDLKSSTILLDQDFNPKLSDYGLAKLEGRGSNTLLTPGVMGTGYCAPEYERTGELTLKSDVYSFGVVLVELISGRRAVDPARPIDQQNLVEWARPIFRDPKRFPEMADPQLKKAFPMTSLNQAVGVAAMCLQEEASVRPLFGDVVAALSFLAMAPTDEPPIPSALLQDAAGPSQDDPDVDASDSDDQSSDSSSSSSDHSDDEDEGDETELERGTSLRIIKTRSSSIRSNTSSSSSSDDDDDGDDDNGKNDYLSSTLMSNSEKSPQENDSISFRNDRISYTDEAGGDLSNNEDYSSRLMVDADKESDSIKLRNDRISDPDEDGGELSFCYSVGASINLRSNSSIRESANESARSGPRKESIIKSENRSFGSYSTSSDEGSDEEDRSWR